MPLVQCSWCSSVKPIGAGLCPSCGRFPNMNTLLQEGNSMDKSIDEMTNDELRAEIVKVKAEKQLLLDKIKVRREREIEERIELSELEDRDWDTDYDGNTTDPLGPIGS